MTTLQDRLGALEQLGGPQPAQLNDLQHEVNAVRDQLNGVSKPPQALLQQMSALQDQMSSLQQRVTAKPADLIAVLQQRGVK